MPLPRRDALRIAGLAALGTSFARADAHGQAPPGQARLTQSVCQWCYARMPLRDFFAQVAALGLTAVDLLTDDQWPVAREYGLTCSMGNLGAGSIRDGLNNPAHHATLIAAMTSGIPRARAAGVPNVICFFGNRGTIADADGIRHSIACLNQVKGLAEDHGVTICVELLNSKVDHKDYSGDRTAYGAEIVRAVGSQRVKLLYDIYHMQIMEGDVIRTIRTHQDVIGHYHTAGVPGRHELDASQELQYPAIVRAIVATGFTGYLAHEFTPERDPMTSLREAVTLCTVS
jgi:hydroxypyruvate isomerase